VRENECLVKIASAVGKAMNPPGKRQKGFEGGDEKSRKSKKKGQKKRINNNRRKAKDSLVKGGGMRRSEIASGKVAGKTNSKCH